MMLCFYFFLAHPLVPGCSYFLFAHPTEASEPVTDRDAVNPVVLALENSLTRFLVASCIHENFELCLPAGPNLIASLQWAKGQPTYCSAPEAFLRYEWDFFGKKNLNNFVFVFLKESAFSIKNAMSFTTPTYFLRLVAKLKRSTVLRLTIVLIRM
ncbi:hypothetical protein QYF36_000842 [Acer negundo]|nr:hypothetical protein QYF36_000842 [Acer negundo]